MVNCVVARRGKVPRNVIFVVNTGAPRTYLSAQAMEAVGMTDVVPAEFLVGINGVVFDVAPVPPQSHFLGVNVLGMDFVSSNELILVPDMKLRRGKLIPARQAGA